MKVNNSVAGGIISIATAFIMLMSMFSLFSIGNQASASSKMYSTADAALSVKKLNPATNRLANAADVLADIGESAKAVSVHMTKPSIPAKNNITSEKGNTSEQAAKATEKKQTTTKKPASSGASLSNKLVAKILSEYNITVVTSNSTYKPMGNAISPIKNSTRLLSALSTIQAELSRYPKAMLSEMQSRGMKLTIYLAESVDGNGFIGLTNISDFSNIKITLIYDSTLANTLHHEMMHYIYTYMLRNGTAAALDKAIAAKNPSGFAYSSGNGGYVYGNVANKNAYFTSDYAKTSLTEDISCIFAAMMSNGYGRDILLSCDKVADKAAEISLCIKATFDSLDVLSDYSWDKNI